MRLGCGGLQMLPFHFSACTSNLRQMAESQPYSGSTAIRKNENHAGDTMLPVGPGDASRPPVACGNVFACWGGERSSKPGLQLLKSQV